MTSCWSIPLTVVPRAKFFLPSTIFFFSFYLSFFLQCFLNFTQQSPVSTYVVSKHAQFFFTFILYSISFFAFYLILFPSSSSLSCSSLHNHKNDVAWRKYEQVWTTMSTLNASILSFNSSVVRVTLISIPSRGTNFETRARVLWILSCAVCRLRSSLRICYLRTPQWLYLPEYGYRPTILELFSFFFLCAFTSFSLSLSLFHGSW